LINLLTVSRVLLLVPLGWVLAATRAPSWAAFAIFIAAGVTDFLDGYLARKLKQTSAFGAMLDQICDKIFIIGTLTAAAAAGLLQNLMLVPMLLIITREFAVAGLREYAAQNARTIPVDKLGKFKTMTQFFAIALMLIPMGGAEFIVWFNHVGAVLLWISALLGIISAVRYLRQ